MIWGDFGWFPAGLGVVRRDSERGERWAPFGKGLGLRGGVIIDFLYGVGERLGPLD